MNDVVSNAIAAEEKIGIDVSKVKDLSDFIPLIFNMIMDDEWETAHGIADMIDFERVSRGKQPAGMSTFINVFRAYIADTSQYKNTDKKYIYVALFEDDTIKIGVSYNPKNRFKALRGGKGYKVKEYSLYKTEKPYEYESILHKKFKNYRIEGEYFKGIDLKTIQEAACLMGLELANTD